MKIKFAAIASGAALLALPGLLVGANAWLVTSYLGPIRNLEEPDFIFQSRPVPELILWCLVSMAALLALHRWRALRHAELAPLLLLVLPLVAVGMLLTPLRPHAAPWLFLFVDFRWWFYLGVAAIQLLALETPFARSWLQRAARFGRALGSQPLSILRLEAALVAVLAVAAIAFSPPGRFQSSVTGDEPKYLRFLENWYRGHGLAVSSLPRIDELPADEGPDVFGNVRHLASALPVIASDLLADARRAAGLSAPPPPGRATSEGGWFVEGKRGGIYQVHNPGLSALLFPGYFVDRYFLNWVAVPSQFPRDLYATSIVLLAVYLLWGVALFRLLLAYTGRPVLAWLLAGIAMLSLPASPFNYQYYPEAAAGLALTVVIHYVIFSADTRMWVAASYGLLAGYLPWLHLRFGLAAVAAAVTYSFVKRHSPRAVLAFWTGLGVSLAALGIYYYHIAGSVLPWALYDVVQESPGFNGRRILYGLGRYLFDWRGGVIAHAPVFLLALPGLFLFWRRRPQVGIPVTAFVLLVAGVAAAHNWHGSGTTPGRLIAAVVPLLTLPLADAVARYARSRVFVVAFVLLAVVSIANGFVYHVYLERMDQVLYGRTISGWMTPLLLPNRTGLLGPGDRLLLAWWILTASLVALPLLQRRPLGAGGSRLGGAGSWSIATATVLVGFALAASAAGSYNQRRLDGRYMIHEERVRTDVLRAHLDHPTGITWSADRGRVDPAGLFPNSADAQLSVEPASLVAVAGEPLDVTIETEVPPRQIAWGMATVDFGDGARAERVPLVGSASVRHTYDKAGKYPITVNLVLGDSTRIVGPSLSSGVRRSDTARVTAPGHVAESEESLRGLPPYLVGKPALFVIETMTIDGRRVDLRCATSSALRVEPDDTFWVWMSGGDLGRPRLHSVRPTNLDADGRRLTLTLSADPPPWDSEAVRIVAGRMSKGPGQPAARTGVVSLSWPGSHLTVGAPLILETSRN